MNPTNPSEAGPAKQIRAALLHLAHAQVALRKVAETFAKVPRS